MCNYYLILLNSFELKNIKYRNILQSEHLSCIGIKSIKVPIIVMNMTILSDN